MTFVEMSLLAGFFASLFLVDLHLLRRVRAHVARRDHDETRPRPGWPE